MSLLCTTTQMRSFSRCVGWGMSAAVVVGVSNISQIHASVQGIADYSAVSLSHDKSAPVFEKSKVGQLVVDFYMRELQPLPCSMLQVVHMMHVMRNYRPGHTWLTPGSGKGMAPLASAAWFRLRSRMGTDCSIKDVYLAYFEYWTQQYSGPHRMAYGEPLWPPPGMTEAECTPLDVDIVSSSVAAMRAGNFHRVSLLG